MPIDSRKGEDNHCWMRASHCLSTPLDPFVRPTYWLFRVATTSLHTPCINATRCTIWLEKTRLHRCFRRIQSVIGLTNSSTTWDLTLIGVEWILSKVGKKLLVLLSSKSSPPPDVRICRLGPAMITYIHFPTWLCLAPDIIAIGGQPPPYSMDLWCWSLRPSMRKHQHHLCDGEYQDHIHRQDE